MMQLKYKRILYSSLVITICFLLAYFIYFVNKPDGKFGAAASFLLLRYAALWGGLAILVCRIIFLVKSNDTLIYIAIGVLNILMAIVAIALFLSNNMVVQILHLFLMNLFIGSIIILDCLFLKKIF